MELTVGELARRSGIAVALGHFVEQAVVAARLGHLRPLPGRNRDGRDARHYGKQMYAWPALIAELRKAMKEGVPPDDARTQALASRWQALFRSYAGDNPGTHARIREAYAKEPDLRSGSAVDDALLDYLRQAWTCAARSVH
ncbi:TipAS antibiotic-recognition domain-containing protein [Dyella sp. C9]|uniref:TipAS antibiotic-recognition domain-containing protein n=1 Tax=Dyella sp. C9 TaxID=2202154 RepID=UPI000DEFBCAA|nr:TipAS antibiotic-recognition domain-containing protein [Dyella sp. C9]